MKLRLIVSSVLVLFLTATIATNAKADPWRGYRRGYCRPHVYARICPPPPPIFRPRVVKEGYYGPRYHEPAYYAPRYVRRGYYGGSYRGYRHCR